MIAFSAPQTPASTLKLRRLFYFGAIFALTGAATGIMASLLWRAGLTGVEWAMLFLFLILFAHIATGFCTALAGGWVMLRGKGPGLIPAQLAPGEAPNLAPTAIAIPIFNEDASRVFAGVGVIFRSLRETGALEHFDFFILSDSDRSNQWIEEEIAWIRLCKEVGGFGRIFYRRRRQAINRKAGNLADFLRRWGREYRYMAVLDADSIMSGRTLVHLVALMEKNPAAGIIQTAPRLVGGETLYARLQAFANRLHSPLFLAGIDYLQQHEANYWGHNAVIRVQPFMQHCALPALPGSERSILSHDFVEAALMGRAGWDVWLVPDLEGSYEESPPTLVDSAKRDRRWCQGNLQHAWLLTARGFRSANRFHLFMGIMAYLSSPLWLLFLILGMIDAFYQAALDRSGVLRVVESPSIFGHALEIPRALTLFLFTLAMLFLPKIAGTLLALGRKDEAVKFGGRGRLAASALLEAVGSVLLAPVNMMFNTKFVLSNLLGHRVAWVAQNRRAGVDGTDWRTALLVHGTQTGLGLVWGAVTFLMVPSYFWWFSPVLAGLVLSIPLSVFLSKAEAGRRARARGIFLTPEETQPPRELAQLSGDLAPGSGLLAPLPPGCADSGLMQAVLDPYLNALHVALLRPRLPGGKAREWLEPLGRRLLREGPGAFSHREKTALLLDAESMIWLHRELWKSPAAGLAEGWRQAIAHYR